MRKSVYDYNGVSPSKGQQSSTCLLLTVALSPRTRRVRTARKNDELRKEDHKRIIEG